MAHHFGCRPDARRAADHADRHQQCTGSPDDASHVRRIHEGRAGFIANGYIRRPPLLTSAISPHLSVTTRCSSAAASKRSRMAAVSCTRTSSSARAPTRRRPRSGVLGPACDPHCKFIQCIGGVQQYHACTRCCYFDQSGFRRVSRFNIVSTLSLCNAKLKRHNFTSPRKSL